MTTPPVKTLLVGYGYWGSKLAEIASRVPQIELIGVVDARVGSTDFTSPPDVPCTSDLSGALSDTAVEAVILSTPATQHMTPATQVLRAGKHLFIEKPFALTGPGCHKLIDLADQRGLMLAVDHQYWWSAEVQAMRDIVASGALGRIVSVSAERSGDGPARSDVDAFWDRGIHDVSVFQHVGIDLREAHVAERVDVLDGDVSGCARITGHVGTRGPVFSFHSCWMGQERRRIVIAGTNGTLVLDELGESSTAWLSDASGRRQLSATSKSAPLTPIELGLIEFANGVRRVPNSSRGVSAAEIVCVMQTIVRSGNRKRSTLATARCWL